MWLRICYTQFCSLSFEFIIFFLFYILCHVYWLSTQKPPERNDDRDRRTTFLLPTCGIETIPNSGENLTGAGITFALIQAISLSPSQKRRETPRQPSYEILLIRRNLKSKGIFKYNRRLDSLTVSNPKLGRFCRPR